MPSIAENNRKWWILVAMTGSLSMILIDTTVVSVALPTIQRDFDMSQTSLQWVVNAYLLSLAALVAVGGRIADILGERRIFVFGAGLFVLASASCGLAQSETWILVGRVIQGAGAAMMVPASQAIVTNTFPIEERGRAMGIYAGVSMVFLALGPLVGGLCTELVSWRLVFWINLPVGVATIVMTSIAKPQNYKQENQSLDWRGLFTLVPGLAALVLALTQANGWGWGSAKTIGLLAAAALLIAAFIFIEPRTHNALVELRLLLNRNFAGDTFVLFCVQFALIGLTIFGALFVQNILGYSPIQAGLSLLPLTIPLLVVAPISGRLYDRHGARALATIGAALNVAGFFWVATVLHKVDYVWMVPGYVFVGVGIGLVMTPTTTDAMNNAAAQLRGQASGVLQTFCQVGGTVGLAIIGSIVSSVSTNRIGGFLNAVGLPADQIHKIEGILSESSDTQSQAAGEISPKVLKAVSDALTSGISAGYYVAGAALVVAAIAAFVTLRGKPGSDTEAGPAVL